MEYIIPRLITYNNILTITDKIYYLCGGIKSFCIGSDNCDVKKCLHELDIEFKLKLVDSILKQEIEKINREQEAVMMVDLTSTIIIDQDVDIDQSDPLTITLFYLQQCTRNIHNELNIIHYKLSRHKKKWFYSWRNVSIDKHLQNLKENMIILKERLDYFVELKKIKI
jgi:hypothetical protein